MTEIPTKAIYPMNEIQNIESILALEGQFIFPFHGVSMRPMLRQETDLCTIRKKGSERLKKYDVALYRRQNNEHIYVLHRIVRVLEEGYIFLGDNCVRLENVREDQVVGVMTSFYRGGRGLFCKREISTGNQLYRCYAHVHLWHLPVRKLYRSMRSKAAHLYRRLFPENPKDIETK